MSAPRVVVLVDFDGTAAAQNVAETLLERFGSEGEYPMRERMEGATARPFAGAI